MDLRNQHIIVFSLFRFDADIESTAYTVASKLAENNTVYYVDHPFTIRDWWLSKNSTSFRKRRRFFPFFSDGIIETPNPDFKIVIPPVLLSLHFLPEGKWYRYLLKWNEALIRHRIRSVLKKHKINDFIFINAFNFHYPTVSEGLSPALRVYYCLDPVAGDFNGRHGLVSEKALVVNSDLVICSSRYLYLEKRSLNPNTHFVPNAADIAHSSKALCAETQLSERLSGISRPVIGYFGSIEHRFDFELIHQVALENTAWNFVLAGPVVTENLENLDRLPNVYFIGKVPYAEMPSVIKGFDVAIIPFKKDESSAAVFPLKLFEYLGAGRPVVATDFNPDLREYTRDLVAFCSGAADFSDAIEEALNSEDAGKATLRRSLAAQHTWNERVTTIARLVAEAIRRKAKDKGYLTR